MNTKLIFVITALIATSSVFAGECPGRAGVCDQRIVTKGTLYKLVGTPVVDVQGRGSPVIAKVTTTRLFDPIASYDRLYKAGRA